MNFELIDNSFQITILGFCTIAALFLALRYKSRSLLILALAYACFCMGTTYYILYLVIMGKVPQVFYVAEISWLAAWLFYDLDLSGVRDAAWIGLPQFVFPKFSWEPVLFMIPVAIAPVIEHIGDVYVVNTVTGKDFVKDPGLHRTLLGDGLACCFAGLVGGPPVTTYSEVTGAMSLTKITNPQVIRIAAISAILFSVVGKISALLKSIPSAVLGGIMLLLFGTIACAGIGNLVNNCIDLSRTRNIIIVSLTLTVGIGGAVLTWGDFSLSGIGLAALVGVLLNLILPKDD